MSINQASAQSIQTQADRHHANWQQTSEGVVFAHHADNSSQFGSAGLTRLGGTPPDENTIFEIGSITKVFTAILLAEAVRENLVNFDDVVSRHLPELKFKKSSPFNRITLTELATHTSGLPRLPADLFKGSDGANPYVHYDDQRFVKSLLSFRKKQLEQPGTYSYSNYGMGILGYVLTQIYGQPFRDLLKEKILNPLEMSSTDSPVRFTELPGHIRERIATPHVAGEAVSHWELGSLAGAGAMISTAADLIRFGTAHWNVNTPVGLAASLAEVAKPRIDDQGLGWVNDGDNLSHGGGTGGFRSNLDVNPIDKTVRVFLSNSAGISHEESVEGNFESIHGYWSGVLNTETEKLRLVSYLDQHGQMVFYSVDQYNGAVLSSKSSFTNDDFSFSFPLIPGVFKGKLQGELSNRELIGSLTVKDENVIPLTMQYSREMPALLRKGLDETMHGNLAGLSGYWWGYLGGKKGLFVYLKITSIGEIPVLRLYSPDQTGHANIISSASLKGKNVQMNSDDLSGSFTGKLSRDGKSMKGKWNQGGSTQLTLRYSSEKPVRE